MAIACAAALALALPTLAWALPSPGGKTVTDPNGISINAKAGSGNIDSVEVATAQAKNVVLSTTDKVLASFDVKGDATNVTLTFNVGTQYAGASVKIFVQHNNGDTEELSGTVASDGTVVIKVDRLSIFTITVDTATVGGNANSMDKGSKSPQTGVDFGTVAGATIVTAIVAGGVAIALRKKVTE